MSDVLVIGGGFAGVWAAAAAVRARDLAGRQDLSVTLVAPGDHLVIRPRLYEADPGSQMQVSLDRFLSPIGVNRVRASATRIYTASRKVCTLDNTGHRVTLSYQRLILAAGSQLRRPALPGADLLHDVDTMAGALALESHLNRLPDRPGRFTAVVAGSGLSGLEIATELAGRLRARAGDSGEVRVILVERAEVVGPGRVADLTITPLRDSCHRR
jgi:NADH dehydrogenase